MAGSRLGDTWAWGGLSETSEETVQLAEAIAPVNLSVDLPVGDVTLKVGEDDLVQVSATKRVWAGAGPQAQAILDSMVVLVDQAGSDVNVRVTYAEDLPVARALPRST